LYAAHLKHANLTQTHLEGAYLVNAKLQDAILVEAHLDGAYLSDIHLKGAYLMRTKLQDADLRYAHLEHARLEGAHLERANLSEAHLEGADLRFASLNETTTLNGTCLGNSQYGYIRVADVRWGGVSLALANLPPAHLLGDEREVYQSEGLGGKPKDWDTRLSDYRAAVRADRQLAVALRNQGMNEDADHFAYRAQLLQQQVLWRQREIGGYLFSRFLDGLVGYGYKPVRGLIAYLVVILGFAFAYGLATHGILTFGLPRSSIQPLQWYEALVLSISSFHGRGFFQPVQSLGDPVAIIAAAEAIIGLLIEISFIATFTQRFFGR
jgi:hypothetical protein